MALYGTLGGTAAALLLFLLFQFCGACVSRAVLPEESGGVKLLLGSVCGSVMLQWFPVLFAFFLDFSLAAHLCGAVLALACAALGLWLGRKRGGFGGRDLLRAFRRRKFLWAVLALLGFYCFLVWKSFLFRDGRVYSSQATYGDMSMHLSFLTSLARQGTFPPDYSLLPGTRLSYPFLGDSISASLYLLGAPLKFAYALPMWAAGAQVFFGFYLFVSRLLGGRGKAAFAFLCFFCNGGLGFLYFLGGGWENFTRIFTAFYETPTNLVGENIRWVNVVVDMMLPQRATLFGWAVLFPALYLLYRAVFEGKDRYFLPAGVLAGALPMIHTHSFLALALVCGAWLVFSLCRDLSWEKRAAQAGKGLVLLGPLALAVLKPLLADRGLTDSPLLLWFACAVLGLCVLLALWLAVLRVRRGGGGKLLLTWGVLLGAVCLLALPQLFTWTFRQAGSGSFVRGHFGWSTGEDGYLWFYLKNIGLTAVLAFCGLLAAKTEQFAKYSPALAVWFLAEFVEFQPNDYDNNKLLYVAFAFLCCAAAEFLAGLLRRLRSRKVRAGVAAAAACVTVCSAVLTMGREAVAEYELFGQGALALCGYVEEELPADAVVLTDTRHNNEIAALTGRNVVCGSPAYLFYHGLPYLGREMYARQMYESPAESEELFRELKVDYVLVSDFERASYQVDLEALDSLFPRVYDDGGRILYQVTGETEK